MLATEKLRQQVRLEPPNRNLEARLNHEGVVISAGLFACTIGHAGFVIRDEKKRIRRRIVAGARSVDATMSVHRLME